MSRDGGRGIAIDLTNEDSVTAAAQSIKQKGWSPSLVICATGLLHKQNLGPEKGLKDIDPQWMMDIYKSNMIGPGPALAAKHLLPIMPRREKAVFAVLGARVGSISDNRLGGWYSYRASKAALHMWIRNIAIEWSRNNPLSIAVALHPGTVDTKLSKPFQRSVKTEHLFTPAYSAQQLGNVIAQLEPSQSGRIFAWDGQEIQP